MVQIVKKKKKGRPSTSGPSSPASAERDLRRKGGRFAAEGRDMRRSGGRFSATERELRRSGRRRNVRYNFDYDDYLDDEEEYYFVEQEDDDNRREKKLELLLKLRREESTNSSSSEDFDNKPKKIRKINEDDEDDNDDDAEDFVIDFEVKKEKKKKVIKEVDSTPGTTSEPPSGFPLPDKKVLVLILDKLQKKDIYGVYAEPVDPEELPDYHDIIEHPMDFSTIRSQLENGSYETVEQLESDILLLCSNAMQYNEPDTVYHKQARSIQEMTKKKFQKLRIRNRPSKNLMKLDPKPISVSPSAKQITRQIIQTVQEPVYSGISSAATLATAGDFQNSSNAVQVNGIRRDSSYDGLVERIPPVNDNSLDKVEESLSGKGSLTRFGRKLPLHDENWRAAYNISNQPEKNLESVFSTFDGESKQLIPVGLHVDLAYASSLARFAGSFGHVAWRVASQRIEQILPPGIKFGRGWVGDYEPLPTPVLILEKCNIEKPAFSAMPHTNNTSNGNIPKTSIASEDNVAGPSSNKDLEYSSLNGLKTTPTSSTNNQSKKEHVRGSILERKPSFYCATVTDTSASSPHLQHQTSATSSPHLQRQTSRMRNLIELNMNVPEKVELNSPPSINHSSAPVAVGRQVSNGSEASSPRPVTNTSASSPHLPHQISASSSPHLQSQTCQTRKLIEHDKNVPEKVELNGPPSINHSSAPVALERRVSNGSEALTPRSVEMISINRNFVHSGSFKQPSLRGVGVGFLSNNATHLDGKVADTVNSDRGPGSGSDVGNVGSLFPHGQEQGLSDPVQQMRMLTEKNKIHHKSANKCTAGGSQIPSPAQLRKEDSRSAAAVTHAWISIGAGGFRPVGENMGPPVQISSMTPNQHPQVSQFRENFPVHLMQFQQQNNSPSHALAPQAVRVGNAAQFPNRPMGLPQFLTTDMSRIQVQFPWRGLMHHHAAQPQKQETSPPDLNVSFQSPGSPGKPLSRVPVDSQQPDLALQL